MNDQNKIIGYNMRNIIEQAGQTQVVAANLLGIKRNALSQYLNGLNIPPAYIIFKFCEVYGTTPNELFGFDNINYNIRTSPDTDLIIDIVDTIDYFLKKNKATMKDTEKKELVKYLYNENINKETIPFALKTWITAKGVTLDKASGE